MRVLISSVWGIGHVFPMVPLARALVDAGHEVVWATPEQACVTVRAAGLHAMPAGLDRSALAELHARTRGEAVSRRPQDLAAFVFPNVFGGAAEAMTADLSGIARSWQPDLLVHDNAELAAPLVASLLGRPCITHSYGGAVPADILADAARVVRPLWSANGLQVPPHAGLFASGYLDICPASLQTVPIHHIRNRQPLRPEPYTSDSSTPLPSIVTRTDPRPLVYLTLGTVTYNPDALRAATTALAALDVRVLVAVGPHGNPDALGRQPDHVQVETWVPQASLLPYCDLVISHAGSGTFFGALAHAIPQLCLPQQADQFRNAQAGSERSVCIALHPDDADQTTIRDATQQLLTNHTFRDAAARVRDEIRAMPSPQHVVQQLEKSADVSRTQRAHGRPQGR